MTGDREQREEIFANAKAAVLGWRPALANGVSVELIEHSESFVVRFADGTSDEPVGATAAQFLRLSNGQRTVGDIIEEIAGEMAIPEAIEAGKASMAALHVFYVAGVLEESSVTANS